MKTEQKSARAPAATRRCRFLRQKNTLCQQSMVASPVSTVANAGGIAPEHFNYVPSEVIMWQNFAKRARDGQHRGSGQFGICTEIWR